MGLIHSGPSCPLGEWNIKSEQEMCASVCMCVCKEATQENSEQQLDRFKFTQDGERRGDEQEQKTMRRSFPHPYFHSESRD